LSNQQQLPWYRRSIVGIEVGPTGAQGGIDADDAEFAARFSGKEIIERCLAAHAEYLVLWAKDNEFAYYDSTIVPKAPGLGARDVLAEAVEAARGQALPIIAYCEIQYPTYLLREHPEYRAIDIDGKEIPGRVCYNSGYLDHVTAIAAEMLAYGIDGFHFDMVDQGFGPPYSCWCKRCRALYRSEYKRSMPGSVKWDADWERMLEFRYNSSARFEQQLRENVRRLHSGASVDFNYHGSPPFSWEVGQRPVQHAHIGDFSTGECGLWAFGALHGSLATLIVAATKPGAVYQMVMQRGAYSYHDQTTRPLADLRWEAFTLLSHGAQVTIVDKTPYDGALDRVAYERMGQVFEEALRKREHFGHTPVQEVGVFYSSRSRDWFGKTNPALYQQACTGAHRALIYAHIPMGVLLDENLTVEKLNAFPVVYLPNTAILTHQEVEMLRAYVQNGGILLLTGMTGLYGPRGQELAESALSDLVGAKFTSRLTSLDNHIALPPDGGRPASLSRDIPTEWPFLVYGPAAIYEPITAEPFGLLFAPHRTLRQRKGAEKVTLPMSAGAPVGPAILINSYGKGKVVTLACSPDAGFASDYRTAEQRLIIRNVIRFLNPTPLIEVDAPLHVESIITSDVATGTIRVHLIGYLTPPGSSGPGHSQRTLPSLMEEAPLYRVRITVRQPFQHARALSPETEIIIVPGGIQATIHDVHETIVLS